MKRVLRGQSQINDDTLSFVSDETSNEELINIIQKEIDEATAEKKQLKEIAEKRYRKYRKKGVIRNAVLVIKEKNRKYIRALVYWENGEIYTDVSSFIQIATYAKDKLALFLQYEKDDMINLTEYLKDCKIKIIEENIILRTIYITIKEVQEERAEKRVRFLRMNIPSESIAEQEEMLLCKDNWFCNEKKKEKLSKLVEVVRRRFLKQRTEECAQLKEKINQLARIRYEEYRVEYQPLLEDNDTWRGLQIEDTFFGKTWVPKDLRICSVYPFCYVLKLLGDPLLEFLYRIVKNDTLTSIFTDEEELYFDLEKYVYYQGGNYEENSDLVHIYFRKEQ